MRQSILVLGSWETIGSEVFLSLYKYKWVHNKETIGSKVFVGMSKYKWVPNKNPTHCVVNNRQQICLCKFCNPYPYTNSQSYQHQSKCQWQARHMIIPLHILWMKNLQRKQLYQSSASLFNSPRRPTTTLSMSLYSLVSKSEELSPIKTQLVSVCSNNQW
jgi:hypothetical protein